MEIPFPKVERHLLLAEILDFAEDNKLETRFSDSVTLYGSMCNPQVTITIESPFNPESTQLVFYEVAADWKWAELARRLECRLDNKWPGKLRYIGPGSELIQRAEFLSVECSETPGDGAGGSSPNN